MQHLLKRGHSFYFNMIIPTKLRHHFSGKTHVRKALSTRDHREAVVRKHRLVAETVSLFRKLLTRHEYI
ncbi:MAG: hypothetical protein IPG63_14180 [Xanthomonadales bacterium]|nr:hypothetical protein [Xanthomonadales bacterium]